ncbi:CBS domain-containing protein [Pseudoxanthomonas sp. 22568]|jgi:CBS domain-containing protein|uniref:CBS domain-containing protein n=1 Tax=unclassified Pseudoxanthomonas TaxID=2645906 RepID=UPI00177BB430|nr:CBS domain-containing protein [Pseudoxanthomonas sp. PXM04]MBD9377896.1 CBS domain-containing protein [Pseudoxanthomonas sp. PXM04]
MKIRELLKSKPGDVVTIDIGDTIGAAARKMTAHKIAALVVTRLAQPVGVVSEQDVVAALAEHGAQAGERPLSRLVDAAIESITPDSTLKQAMSMMTHARRRHLPVISDDELVGIVSLGDIVKNRLDELSLERDVLRDIYIAAH